MGRSGRPSRFPCGIGILSIGTGPHSSMAEELKILLVSPDLLATSRLASLCREAGATLETLRSLADSPHGGPHDVVLLDLQALSEDPAVVVTRARAAAAGVDASGPAATIVAFGPHVARERLQLARDAGADDVVSRGELLGGFAGLLRRWRGDAGG
jgi:hypothetical protein